MGDATEYIVSAKNSEGETTAKAKLKTNSKIPVYIYRNASQYMCTYF